MDLLVKFIINTIVTGDLIGYRRVHTASARDGFGDLPILGAKEQFASDVLDALPALKQ